MLSDLSLLQREELFKTLRVSITHHSNAIEGISLSYGETKTLLETGKTANNKPLDEQLVILGFAQAYDLIIREANDKNKILDSSFIKDLHFLIFSNAQKICPHLVRKPIGAYRNEEVKIVGSSIKLTLPHLISQELENLLYRFPSNQLNLEQIAEFHALYEKIHPFSDGNGRTGRLLMSFQCIQNNLIPPLIENENRKKYLEFLQEAQINNNIKAFAEFLEYCQKRSLDLIDRDFTQKQENKFRN
ncbi:Fic family protein [Campylobacter upsaliensis]|uniref:Fic family protein n=1 Tax=Campylobacter helveticus TaxID=28898 RepID=A0ABY3KZ32_9BACT|nr:MULTISPECIES: Fic family protein [Campylobacter]EEY3085982.1 Fic family protein [Campylobacter jejuni]EAH5200728.1 Fic family protein [Campylobacter upsaliensis]EAI3917880.1 Fic family protein [Campylobacter upsaliensis]EAI4345249.1 Fic family protein [Campylobacter upsaliensis]EAI8173699.1 Fic family protein [Campylobacter upsaliensis]